MHIGKATQGEESIAPSFNFGFVSPRHVSKYVSIRGYFWKAKRASEQNSLGDPGIV
jgi:hypothetical protein